MGARPAGGPSDEQLKRLANTLNELGSKTIAMGVRLAPHPHIWGPLEPPRIIICNVLIRTMWKKRLNMFN